MGRLNVELYGVLLGTLGQSGTSFDFRVEHSAFERYQLSSTIMSLAVPLGLKYTTAQKKRSSNFFAELLPEGRNYEWLEQSLPYAQRTPYGTLRRYGKDIAGALIIYDPDDPSSTIKAEAELIDDKGIRYLLEHMPQQALANAPDSGKTSLGGVQGKIVLAKKDEAWCRVSGGYPSTHILKPVVSEYTTMIYDEAFCMEMAYLSGLTNHPVWIENFDGVDALVIERYDRIDGGRIHQEDFNQALGAHGHEKYQEYGGRVSAKRIAQTLDRFGTIKDVAKFASQLIFAIAIGNLDMHAKNISILHYSDESIALAPTYDQVPLRHHGTDGRMALAINGQYMHSNISMSDIVSELAIWRCGGFADETAFISDRLETFLSALKGALPIEKAYPNLIADISGFITNLLSGKTVGGQL